MSAHRIAPWWHGAAESTRRATRTGLQGLATFVGLIVAFAIPPVGDAINAVLGLLPFIDFEVTPGLVTAVGLVGVALLAVIAKVQNLIEGRDKVAAPEDLAREVLALSELINELVAALTKARSEGIEEVRSARASLVAFRDRFPEGTQERSLVEAAVREAGL